MRSPEVKAFIQQQSSLFWYISEGKKEEVSDELLVETILNYETMESFIQLFNLIGIKKVADIFHYTINMSDRRRGNYNDLTLNYFIKLFDKYAGHRRSIDFDLFTPSKLNKSRLKVLFFCYSLSTNANI